ncbi:hypothetical protein GCM10009836_31230 [Pseudonocardia ailaonensis]|uniref:Predicted membrane protein YciQ-like C-terminal domain-containing protein n=1 Tax=Pseudonocardia ailaonensis TaxID=367279 RepID=A0ABN2N3G5_9PSEU
MSVALALLGVLIAGGAWFALLTVVMAASRTPPVRPGPATGALGPESPAIVDLVTGGWELCDEAASATLLDLAARRVIGIEEIGPELSLVRLGRGDPPALAPYEKLVLDHVRTLATADGVVATGALAEGARNLGSWWKSFTKAVIAEARAAGLSRPRWSAAQRTLLLGAAVVPAAVVGIAAAVWLTKPDDGPIGPFAGGAVLAFAGLSALVGKLDRERGTQAGADAAGRWLGVREHLAGARFAEAPAASVTIWGRPLAYAAALGLAGRAVAGLPVSTPADDSRAWSDRGGMWHVVHVDYRGPGPWGRFFWGRSPLHTVGRLALAAIPSWGFAFLLGILARALLDSPFPPEAVGFVGLVLVVAVPLVNLLLDAAGRSTVEGQVVRLRTKVRKQNDSSTTYDHYVGLDTGAARGVHAVGTDETRWNSLTEGDVVRATISGRIGWLHEVEILTPSRMRPTGPAAAPTPD